MLDCFEKKHSKSLSIVTAVLINNRAHLTNDAKYIITDLTSSDTPALLQMCLTFKSHTNILYFNKLVFSYTEPGTVSSWSNVVHPCRDCSHNPHRSKPIHSPSTYSPNSAESFTTTPTRLACLSWKLKRSLSASDGCVCSLS